MNLRRRLTLAAVGALATATCVGQVAAQGRGPYRSSGWSGHAHGTVVAMVLRIPAGSADDEAGFEGTASLLARVIRDQANRALGPARGTVTVTVDRNTTTFTLLALPDAWPGAEAVVDSVIFQAPVDGSLLERHRRDQLARLAFETDSPSSEFEAAAVRLIADADDPWARPIRGTPESLAAIGSPTLEEFRRFSYRREGTARAVVGPRSLLSTRTDSAIAPGAAPATPPDTAGPPAPAPRPAPDSAPVWITGERRVLVRDVTSTWIRVAYPIPRTASRTAVEMLASLVEEELDPTPPDPDRYGVDVRLLEAPRGNVLVVDATVFPEAADRWERRITDIISRFAGKPMGADLFGWHRRRFRTERLLEEATPEAEARRMAGDLLRTGRIRDLGREIWDLQPEAVFRAAGSLGEARILRFGPDLAQVRPQGTGGGGA